MYLTNSFHDHHTDSDYFSWVGLPWQVMRLQFIAFKVAHCHCSSSVRGGQFCALPNFDGARARYVCAVGPIRHNSGPSVIPRSVPNWLLYTVYAQLH